MRKLSKDEFVMMFQEEERIRKKRFLVSEADIHAIENAQRIRKRTRRKGGTSYDASNY